MDENLRRRRTGLIIGLFLGTGYALTSNLINRLVLPGIPLYTPPPGVAGLIVVTILMFGVLGSIATWTDEALPGVLLSGFIGSLISSAWNLATETDKFAALTLVVVIFMPRVFFYLPFGGTVRWLTHTLTQPTPKSTAPLRKLIPTFLVFIFMVVAGMFAILPKETRSALVRMDVLLQTGINSRATSRSQLPKSFQSVNGFIRNAKGDYRYTIGSNPDVLPVQRPFVGYGVPEPFIIVRFENGFRFGCVFSPPYIEPACADF